MTSLALHDHGGDGPPLLLLHGAGRSRADWDAAARRLTARHRVLAADLPGHGGSPGRSPWTVDGVLDDIEDALDGLGLPGAALAGHSLGGLIAVRYAETHPGVTPAAVNLDGFGWGRPGRYPDAARVREMGRAAAGAVQDAGYIERQTAYAELFGVPAERARAAALGTVRPLPDGRWQTLPERTAALEMLDALDALDAVPLLRRAPCPLLVVRARRPQPPTPGMEWFDALLAEFARDLDEELALLTKERERAEVVEIDATHALLLEEPEAVAELVGDFLARVAGR
ncbi:alpha/beta fold hydrolase [Streptomyces sp. NPDC014894]|uniref:alpha/beta fold hydrolase n=1 Tax=unclassified Streptomyces TaxID=2593676 RepID=UPI0036F6F2D1